jgi:hypothetical protein
MTQPPNQPYDPGQGYNPNQSYNPAQGQQAQTPPSQPYAYGPAQAQQYAAQQQYQAMQGTPKKRFSVKQIVPIILVAVVVVAGAWSLWGNFQTNENLKVGNCLVITGEANNANEEKIDCSDKSKFSFEVTQVVSSSSACPNGSTYYEITSKSRRSSSTRTEKVACLIPNLHPDVCYKTTYNATAPYEVADCGSADVKVTKRIDQANASCGQNEEDLVFTDPARTYCLAEAK